MANQIHQKQVWSFFTGAMGLDLGLEEAGLQTSLAVECDADCRGTIRKNRPNILLPDYPSTAPGDVTSISGSDLRNLTGFDDEVFLMIGGPPCQSFSPGGKRAALSDPRGNLIYHYLRLIEEVCPRFFLLENVGNLVTAAIKHRPIDDRPGKQWSLKKYSQKSLQCMDGNLRLEEDELSGSAIRKILNDMRSLGYSLNFGVLNSADYGAPQKRLRFILLGSSHSYAPELPPRSHTEFPGNNEAFEPY
ncbi:MAG: DNA cytosine methyltransferase [Planctomycetes bacterium]|nr:DNA cytosine methyltransferase [Planctomycetota bacterium]